MKTILCYGDSNTWGYNPASSPERPAEARFGLHERWPGVLRDTLGSDYWVVEEGLNGRTTVWPDPIEGHKSGKEYLIPCLETHQPIDLVIILLGTNDLKQRFSLPTCDVAAGAGVLVGMAQQSAAGPDGRPPQVLLLAPPPFAPLTAFAEMFAGGEEKSRRFGAAYAEVAGLLGCHFLDTGSIVTSSPLDGIHLERGEHARLGQAVAEKVRRILG